MQRIPQVDPAKAPAEVAATLGVIKSKIGKVPNILKTMAQAPAVLNSYLAFSGAIGAGKLSPALREQLALVTAGANSCDYCASAHSAAGKIAGLAPDEINRNLAGEASDARAKAALAFARKLVINRGVVSDAEIVAVKSAGFTDEDVLEILGNVALNLFTNYFNHLAATDIDFPRVETASKEH
ncbi:peroxidase [Bradyrhizobium nanningense]|uniref:Peroxidase n=1 Tax=Bradyrhizobium nanningense TaxID=1325118 RepID=A0A4Q0S1D1_9BRAD|nr:peroxidase-related enzyme [Bradyrhizobium nanningense]RXH26312.1 peroxidase [Bradyrhizobium nanningense]RXH29546.1 peroxidase [Bradyrhizobium nanningense]